MSGGIQEQETFATIPAETPPQPQTPPPANDAVDEDDLDAMELLEARREVEAEQTDGEGDEQGQSQPDPAAANDQAKQAAQQPAKPEGEDQGKPAPVMIPKDRLDEVLRRNSELERTQAYLQGQLEAVRGLAQQGGSQQQGQQPQQQRPPTLEEALAQVHSQQDALAAKFDDGEISYAELQKQQRALANQEQSLREQQLMARMQSQQPQNAQPQGDSLYLDTLTKQLEEQHPYLHVMSDVDFQIVTRKAHEELAAEGFRFDNTDNARYQLRARVAQLSDRLGPALTGKTLPLPGQQQPQTPPGPSSAAQARAAKLNLQGQMPPDLSSIPNQGGGSGNPGELSDAEIENMTDEEILVAMPAAARRKALGITD